MNKFTYLLIILGLAINPCKASGYAPMPHAIGQYLGSRSVEERNALLEAENAFKGGGNNNLPMVKGAYYWMRVFVPRGEGTPHPQWNNIKKLNTMQTVFLDSELDGLVQDGLRFRAMNSASSAEILVVSGSSELEQARASVKMLEEALQQQVEFNKKLNDELAASNAHGNETKKQFAGQVQLNRTLALELSESNPSKPIAKPAQIKTQKPSVAISKSRWEVFWAPTVFGLIGLGCYYVSRLYSVPTVHSVPTPSIDHSNIIGGSGVLARTLAGWSRLVHPHLSGGK